MARSTVAIQFGGSSVEARDEARDARDLETLTYTLLGEARGEGVEGMVAVANVIRNRSRSGVYPSNPVDVVLQPWQFSTNNVGGNQEATRREAPAGSALYQRAQQIAQRYILDNGGIDLTGGSLFYHIEGLPWRYADAVRGPYGTHVIGGHVFYPVHPVPAVDVGESDLLAGYSDPGPMPLPRSSRPGGYAETGTARALSAIEELKQETAVQRLVAENAIARGLDVTPRITDTNKQAAGRRPEYDARFDLERGAFVMRDQFVGEYSNFGPEPQALGFGSLIGKNFPMVPNTGYYPSGGARPEGQAGSMPAAAVPARDVPQSMIERSPAVVPQSMIERGPARVPDVANPPDLPRRRPDFNHLDQAARDAEQRKRDSIGGNEIDMGMIYQIGDRLYRGVQMSNGRAGLLPLTAEEALVLKEFGAKTIAGKIIRDRSEEHTSELQSRG